ncbi:MAG TPA: hypothetical protein VN634_07520 [Candidatus Limnocylindrales bacterium]|nr:hypothetical protein [Candidatus Limnocylindrales bacterium]
MKSRDRDLVGAGAIFVAAMAYFASFAPWTRPVLLDAATWDYMALETARGLVPYRDVFLHKTPGAALLGAVAARIGMATAIEPVLAVHALSLVFGALAAVLLFALCRTRLPLGVSLAAAVGLFAYDEWVVSALEGCSPKVATVMFGLASMLAAERGAAFSSSVLGGCSVLCWQPGLAFLLGSWAAILRRGERRPLGLLAIAAASLIPSIALLSWFAAHGALRDFFDQAVLFNLQYIDTKARTPLGTLRALTRTIGEWNDIETLLAPAAIAGLVLGRRLAPGGSHVRLPVSLVVYGLIYGGMTFVSYQSWPDAILLGPIVAALLATGLWSLLRLRLSDFAAAAAVVAVLALAAIPGARPRFHPPVDFSEQRERFAQLAAGLSPSDRVISVSVPEFLIHTGLRNGWKWPYLWFGVDSFAADHTDGGFDGILGDLDRSPPALMLVGRLWAGPERARFEQWAAGRYEIRSVRIFPHVKRPLRMYRLKG